MLVQSALIRLYGQETSNDDAFEEGSHTQLFPGGYYVNGVLVVGGALGSKHFLQWLFRDRC